MHPPNIPPPPHLRHLKELARHHPSVVRVGYTATESGEWALLVWLREDADAPLEILEQEKGTEEIRYVSEAEYLPIARPAFPALGQ